VLEGVDKGRIFRDLPTPLTIGREEGNVLRLNDERVSRFHAKIQLDGSDVVLTDLESTNGTRVNGNVVQIRRLRVGDRICLGRSLLLYGSNEEIAARAASLREYPADTGIPDGSFGSEGPATLRASSLPSGFEQDYDFEVNLKDPVTITEGKLFVGDKALPPLPQKLTPAQAARAAEIFDFLHRGLTAATDNVRADEEATEVHLNFADWQKILAVQMLLARYLRAISEPDSIQH
jgi:hypothetical protein